MEAAPYFSEVADAPPGGRTFWLTTADSVRIRIGIWAEGEKGTVLLFPGRTEYVEKYGRAARDLRDRGYSTVSIDWRGQGLADRFLDDPATGHVGRFRDYQHDVAALVDAVRKEGLPRPYFMLAHSMGGAIGLRALIDGLEVRAAAFSAPMWGILMAPHLRPFAWSLSWASRGLGFGHKYTPGTRADSYVEIAEFDDNTLTSDREMFEYMQTQVSAHPELRLGGPSLNWLYEALCETRFFRTAKAPSVPTYTAIGSCERIVDPLPVKSKMQGWLNGTFACFKGSEHEILMENAETRGAFLDQATALFAANS